MYAAGVQFPPVRFRRQDFHPGQGNNLYIFPAVGLAIYATRAKRVTDEMFIAAARAVADQVTQAELTRGCSIRHRATSSKPKSRRRGAWPK